MKTFQVYLPDGARSYNCAHCRANLADHNELISKVVLFLKPKLIRCFLVIPRKSRESLLIQLRVSHNPLFNI